MECIFLVWDSSDWDNSTTQSISCSIRPFLVLSVENWVAFPVLPHISSTREHRKPHVWHSLPMAFTPYFAPSIQQKEKRGCDSSPHSSGAPLGPLCQTTSLYLPPLPASPRYFKYQHASPVPAAADLLPTSLRHYTLQPPASPAECQYPSLISYSGSKFSINIKDFGQRGRAAHIDKNLFLSSSANSFIVGQLSPFCMKK